MAEFINFQRECDADDSQSANASQIGMFYVSICDIGAGKRKFFFSSLYAWNEQRCENHHSMHTKSNAK